MKKITENLLSQISAMKKQYIKEGFDIVGIFGSYAKGNAGKYSDIDIAYTIDYKLFDTLYQGGFSKLLRIEEMKKELQQLLHLKVDLISIDSVNHRFNEDIEKEMLYV